MANELNLALGQTGQNVTAQLLLAGVPNPTIVTLNEVPNVGGYYTGSMPALAAGFYEVLFYVDTTTLRGSGSLNWDGSAEVTLASRLAASAYVAPDNAGIASILALVNGIIAAGGATALATATAVWNFLMTSVGSDATTIGGFLRTMLNSIKVKTELITTGQILVVPAYVVSTRTLTMYRGDTVPISFTGVAAGMSGATAITLSARRAGSLTVLAQLTGGTAPSDTALSFVPTQGFYDALPSAHNDYVFDVQVTKANGDRFTPIQTSRLTILDDVTP